ncbi:MAG: glycine oxidase ThiO [Magnetococcales bacterium]|nr:glycine oxidase ThiO [Magnetococcales bacterium]MBF0418635.1 glycine oxidase ThiO [Magnetococcales bacterium]MBF0435428.1 glycine oxidase ThiO [Magnetococcales bacterium]
MGKVCIIGAGVMGTATAHRLLERGFSVTLLEKSLPGAESSAAAAGILGAQSEVSGAGPFLELCLASRAMFREYVRELESLSGVGCDFEDSGVLEVALTPAEGRLAAGRAQWMLEQGLKVELLDREQAKQLEPNLTDRMVGANFYPEDCQLDPVRLASALAGTVHRLGGVFQTGLQVLGLETRQGKASGVRTSAGVIPADCIVVAGGAWSTGIADLPPTRTTIKPMSGQIIQVLTRPSALRHVLYGYQGYVVPRRDGRVLMGSTLEERGFDKAVTLNGLHRISSMARDLAPILGEARLDATWSGLRPASADGLPMLGESRHLPGLFFATGHYRNGILLTPITGRILADLIEKKTPPVTVEPFLP